MQKQSFNRGWRFCLEDTSLNTWQLPDVSTWRAVDLPHDWSIELERSAESVSGTAGGFFQMGRGWYTKTFDAPEAWRGKKVMVEFEGVYMNAEIWLNAQFLGRHPYGYTSFQMDLSPYLKAGSENVLKVRVDNSHQLNSRWYSGSGIYRPVWLLVAEPVHVAPWGICITTPQVSTQTAKIHVVTTLENDSDTAQNVTVRSRLVDPNGATVGSADHPVALEARARQAGSQILHVPNPRLWSPETPTLYRIETELLVNGKSIDTASTPFGIRSIHVDAETGLLFNGKPLKLKGGCVHHDNGVLGAVVYPRAEERKVEVLKASGYNAIRCAHNPPSPAFLDACDRLGMLVIDEAFDCWRDGKNPGDYHAAFDDWWERDIRSMVLRDTNHPSIIMWSIGNELVERGRPQGGQIAKMLAEAVRALDPSRPITAAICDNWDKDWTWPDTVGVFAPLNVGGYNYLWARYADDHQQHPARVMMGTESFPKEAYENWKAVLDNPYVIGDFVWTSLDYLGEAGIGRMHFGEGEGFLGKYPWHQAYCGDLDLCGFKRPQSYYRDMVWGAGEKLYIAVHAPIPEGKTPVVTQWGWPDVLASWNWPGFEGQTLKVDVYSTCEMVELFLNGHSVGVKTCGETRKYLATFEVAYQPGELKAVGQGAELTLKTAAPAASLRLSADRTTLKAGEDDLAYITVEIVDEQGTLHPAADRPVNFTVQGQGSLAAVGSGNPVSTEMYRGNSRSTFRGRCLAVVKTGDTPGEIHLRAQADGLESAEIILLAA